ncbi:hypothetical protein BU597_12455 [Staphylococcus arlettae]|nr:hypothetical protein BU605_13065 [Staphylococcus arlettae]PTH50519.1 hypothetical protein BU597_12455 [Staphylococcus arlettae]
MQIKNLACTGKKIQTLPSYMQIKNLACTGKKIQTLPSYAQNYFSRKNWVTMLVNPIVPAGAKSIKKR